MTKADKILVFLLAGAGDTLLTTPLLRELKAVMPDADIDVLVMQGPSSCQVLEGNPAISKMHYHDFRKKSVALSLAKCMELRREHYDYVIVPMPHNRLPYNLIAGLVGGRQRIGYEYSIKCGTMSKLFFHRLLKEDSSMHLVNNNLRLIKEGLDKEPVSSEHKLELFLDDSNKVFASDFLKDSGLSGERVVGIHPGSGITKNLHLKRWDVAKWADVAKEIVYEKDAGIVVIGGPEEEQLKTELIELTGLESNRIVSLDRGSVRDMAAVISQCEFVVSGDTLVPHVCAAVGVPVAVIYGPTSHEAAYPFGDKYEIVRAGLDCSPCYGFSKYGIRCTNDVFMKCLKDVTVKEVMEAVNKLMASKL
ncbi:hypothetical protein BVX97_01315 [bacterium E08(2017)]|nr:hypothetical protein BVX97_01315 [bacterium E08(2017)]